MKNYVITEVEREGLQAMQQTLMNVLKNCQVAMGGGGSAVFVRSGDYVGLAIELWARERAGLRGVTEFGSIRETADAWSERLGWPVEEKQLGRQLKRVRETWGEDIKRRTEMLC